MDSDRGNGNGDMRQAMDARPQSPWVRDRSRQRKTRRDRRIMDVPELRPQSIWVRDRSRHGDGLDGEKQGGIDASWMYLGCDRSRPNSCGHNTKKHMLCESVQNAARRG